MDQNAAQSDTDSNCTFTQSPYPTVHMFNFFTKFYAQFVDPLTQFLPSITNIHDDSVQCGIYNSPVGLSVVAISL